MTQVLTHAGPLCIAGSRIRLVDPRHDKVKRPVRARRRRRLDGGARRQVALPHCHSDVSSNCSTHQRRASRLAGVAGPPQACFGLQCLIRRRPQACAKRLGLKEAVQHISLTQSGIVFSHSVGKPVQELAGSLHWVSPTSHMPVHDSIVHQ